MTLLPQPILDEINRHDMASLKPLSLDHQGVTQAIAFFMQNGMDDMAKHIRQMAISGLIRQGPFEGFVAAGSLSDSGECLLLSTFYPEYNTPAEIMASLVFEVGSLNAFKRSSEENELRAQKALEWLSSQKSARPEASFITIAAQKTEKKVRRGLVDVLLVERIITPQQYQEARAKHLEMKKPIHDVLIEMGLIHDDQLIGIFAKVFDLFVKEIKDEDIDPVAYGLLNVEQMRQFGAYVVRQEAEYAFVAMSNPKDDETIEQLASVLKQPVKPILVSRKELLKRIGKVTHGS